MVNLIIIGNTPNADIARSLKNAPDLNIIGGVVDSSNDSVMRQQTTFLKENNIPQIQIQDIPDMCVDLCMIITYSKIIDTNFFRNTLCLNIHAGILPKWRGFNANAWAIVNNENEVGYTLHKVTDEFDAGDIYYRFIEKISLKQKYGDIVPILRRKVCELLPRILVSIHNNELKPEIQDHKKSFYCSKFRKNDGIIKNWNMSSRHIYNLFRVLGAPYGTGVFFHFNDEIYEVKNMRLIVESEDYLCIPGAIVNIFQDKMWVKTSDNIIEISEITKNNQKICIHDNFKIGCRLFSL